MQMRSLRMSPQIVIPARVHDTVSERWLCGGHGDRVKNGTLRCPLPVTLVDQGAELNATPGEKP